MSSVVTPFPQLSFTVDSIYDGLRIDSFLAKHLRNYSTFRLARIITAGHAHIAYQPVTIERRVFQHEEVTITLVEPPDMEIPCSPDHLDIIFEDPWIMVINKPAGWVAHATGDYQRDTLAHKIQYYLDQQTHFPQLLRAGIVHRLDRQTSGLMVLAKEHQSHRILGEAFASSRISKAYLALLAGRLEYRQGTINKPIGRSPEKNCVLMSTKPDAIDKKPAKTNYKVISYAPEATMVLAQPTTGRNHQIRVHFAALGHPLLDEPFYDHLGNLYPKSPTNIDDEDDSRHALHACSLAFGHPITGAWLKFYSKLPEDLRQLWEAQFVEQDEGR